MVLAVNGTPVKASTELTREVAKARPGDVLHLDVIRDGKRPRLDVRSGIRPSEQELALNDNTRRRRRRRPAPATRPRRGRPPTVLGMALGPLDEAARRRIDMRRRTSRAWWSTASTQDSDAGQKGLQARAT